MCRGPSRQSLSLNALSHAGALRHKPSISMQAATRWLPENIVHAPLAPLREPGGEPFSITGDAATTAAIAPPLPRLPRPLYNYNENSNSNNNATTTAIITTSKRRLSQGRLDQRGELQHVRRPTVRTVHRLRGEAAGAHRGELRLLPCLQLALWTQVAEAAVLPI